MPSGLTTVPENTSYTPVADTPYQVAYLFPLNPENPTFGDKYYREEGIFRVMLMYPNKKGTGSIQIKAEAIKDYFYRSLTLTEGSVQVIIEKTPSVSSGKVIDDRYSVNVDIKYFCSILKP